ncbi:MAG TPA: ABC transporter ATP-binding protein [Aliidongia sp.]|nr:ABC transporter ATP-binding protein [Aliidongia sp.]
MAKRFANGTLALTGLDLDVRPGEFLSLLGPSGCGKSTALRLIAGLAAPSDGRVRWDGHDRPPRPGDIGFVFQEPTLMPWARVLANVTLPLRLGHTPRGEALDRAREALALVGLAGFERAFPRELSGGMRMRVSIARALVMRPRLLLMDEPFAALDEITRLKLNDDLLAVWAERGLAIVFVTHSVYESVYLSSRVAIMAARPGRIVEDRALAAAYPRSAAFRHGAAYGAQCAEISAALGRAMAA